MELLEAKYRMWDFPDIGRRCHTWDSNAVSPSFTIQSLIFPYELDGKPYLYLETDEGDFITQRYEKPIREAVREHGRLPAKGTLHKTAAGSYTFIVDREVLIPENEVAQILKRIDPLNYFYPPGLSASKVLGVDNCIKIYQELAHRLCGALEYNQHSWTVLSLVSDHLYQYTNYHEREDGRIPPVIVLQTAREIYQLLNSATVAQPGRAVVL